MDPGVRSSTADATGVIHSEFTAPVLSQALLFNAATGESVVPDIGLLNVLSTSHPLPKSVRETTTNGWIISPIAEAFKRLEEIERLDFDWDSYGSEAPTDVAVAAGRGLVWTAYLESVNTGRRPALPYATVPLSGGGVQLEWRGVRKAIEVEISPEGLFGYLLVKGEKPAREFEEEDNVPQSRILELIRSVVP